MVPPPVLPLGKWTSQSPPGRKSTVALGPSQVLRPALVEKASHTAGSGAETSSSMRSCFCAADCAKAGRRKARRATKARGVLVFMASWLIVQVSYSVDLLLSRRISGDGCSSGGVDARSADWIGAVSILGAGICG